MIDGGAYATVKSNIKNPVLSAELNALEDRLRKIVPSVDTGNCAEVWDNVSSILYGIDDFMRRITMDSPTLLAQQAASVRQSLKLLTEAPSDSDFINLVPPWRRAKYKELVCEKGGADWFTTSPAERRQRAIALGAEIAKEYEDFEVTQAVFEKLIEPTLIDPVFVTHAPKELIPLAKLSPDDPTTVEVFECCINGQEIAPAYSEQNDPLEQRERLEHQAGGETQKLDEDFLVALEHGMPPAGGMGLGIDRLCMMLLGQESIRDVILFPQLKPKA